MHRELRHHNPNVRLNSWDERVEHRFFLMMGWRDLKNPGAGALPLCAVTQLVKSVQVTESKSERGLEGAAMREGEAACCTDIWSQVPPPLASPPSPLLPLSLCTLLLNKHVLVRGIYVIGLFWSLKYVWYLEILQNPQETDQ